jgi:hypothetical protein
MGRLLWIVRVITQLSMGMDAPLLVHAAKSENCPGDALTVEFIEELSARIRQGRDLCHTSRRAFRALAGTVIEGYKPARFHAASAALS